MKGYFKGFYYKHQKDDNTISFISGYSEENSFIQVIHNNGSFSVPYIGSNVFSKEGIKVDIKSEGNNISGEIKYGALTPVKYDIMGPFKYFPMECRHKIVSMSHCLNGYILLNSKRIDFNGGKGYLEGDSGKSFPNKYLWIQSNDFEKDCSIIVSIADVPFCKLCFQGCICVINYEGKEYRLATYLGVKIIEYSNKRVVLKQGKYFLIVDILSNNGYELDAPYNGKMTRLITEDIACKSRFRFYKENELLFDLKSRNSSFEYVI